MTWILCCGLSEFYDDVGRDMRLVDLADYYGIFNLSQPPKGRYFLSHILILSDSFIILFLFVNYAFVEGNNFLSIQTAALLD